MLVLPESSQSNKSLSAPVERDIVPIFNNLAVFTEQLSLVLPGGGLKQYVFFLSLPRFFAEFFGSFSSGHHTIP
jgi:hypothetical protein